MYFLKAMRLDHWLKNLLIFVPIFSTGIVSYSSIVVVLKVFFSFSICVSSTYILNDLIDLDSDKLHPNKKSRPIASGVYTKNQWLIFSAFLLVIGILLIFLIDKTLIIPTSFYISSTLLYSLKLKYVKYLDLVTISALFVIRLFIGGAALQITISPYLLFFVLFASLGIVSSKKISILKNESLQNLKIKKFLNGSYSYAFLKNLIYSSFLSATLVYLLWIVDKKESLGSIQFFFLTVSLAFFVMFNLNFVVKTVEDDTEEIIKSIEKESSLKILSILFLTFALLGLLW